MNISIWCQFPWLAGSKPFWFLLTSIIRVGTSRYHHGPILLNKWLLLGDCIDSPSATNCQTDFVLLILMRTSGCMRQVSCDIILFIPTLILELLVYPLESGYRVEHWYSNINTLRVDTTHPYWSIVTKFGYNYLRYLAQPCWIVFLSPHKITNRPLLLHGIYIEVLGLYYLPYWIN